MLRCRDCPLSAKSRLMHRSKQHLYSITSSARVSSDAGRRVMQPFAANDHDHLIHSVLSFHISDTLIDHGIECSPLFRIEASPAFRRQLFSVI